MKEEIKADPNMAIWTMRRNIGHNFQIPPATLQSFITISIIILMPFYDKVLVPSTRLITRSESGISVLQRIGIGMNAWSFQF